MPLGRQVLLRTFNAPLELQEVDIPDPAQDEVLIRVELAGVCGSDVHTWRGEIPRDLPIVLGHEGVGRVAALGHDVKADSAGMPLKEGDRISWSPARPCYRCRACTIENDPSACDHKAVYGPTGGRNRNSYADYAVLALGGTFYKIDDDTPSEAVIALGCAMPTMLQAFDRLGSLQASNSLVVQGCGPVGLAAILLARRSGITPIVALDKHPDRLQLALTIGATHTIPVGANELTADRAELVRRFCGGRGADIVIEATGNLAAFSDGLRFVGRNGRYLIVGLWAGKGTVPIDPHEILRNDVRIIGSAYAAPVHYYRAVEIAQRCHREVPLADIVTRRFGLPYAIQAFEAVQTGEAGKTVLAPTM